MNDFARCLWRRLAPCLILVGMIAGLAQYGCASRGGADGGAMRAATFSSPRQAVPEIQGLLRSEDWTALAAYYDLSESNLDRAELESGNFFIVRDTRALAQPVEVTRYRHPFAPAFEFDRIIPTDDPEIIIVQMSLEIDQGEGAPLQRGLMWFKMKQTPTGWVILPDAVDAADLAGEGV